MGNGQTNAGVETNAFHREGTTIRGRAPQAKTRWLTGALKNGVTENTYTLDVFNIFGDEGDLVFPAELRGQSDVHMIQFTAHGRSPDGQKRIFLPCPANIAINDAATYNTVDLGVFGGIALKSLQGATSPAGLANSVIDQGRALKNSHSGLEIISAVGQKIPSMPGKGISALKGRTLMNPNTHTTFSGNALRSFSFAFKMIAETSDEAETIRQITHRFRQFAYADPGLSEQSVILSFPPTWTIHFLVENGNENKFIPRIYSCYLTGVGSTFNSTTNMFHSDGAPLEVDISLSFQETRTLNRADITNGHAGPGEEGSWGPNREITNGATNAVTELDAQTGMVQRLTG